MQCLVCGKIVEIVRQFDSGLVYLGCLHKARINPDPSQERVWSGFLDQDYITIDLTNSPILPLGDMDSGDKWNPYSGDFCPTCGAVAIDIGAYSGGFKLICGHIIQRSENGSITPVYLKPTREVYQKPETIQPTPMVPVPPKDYIALCPLCNKEAIEIGSHQVAGWPIVLKLKCGHKAVRNQESKLITLEEAGYRG